MPPDTEAEQAAAILRLKAKTADEMARVAWLTLKQIRRQFAEVQRMNLFPESR